MLQGHGRYGTALMVGSVMAQLKVLMQLNCPTSFFSCSLDTWKHTEDLSLLSPLPFTDSLCDDPKVFQQRKACKAEDHLSALGRACSLGLRAAFLPAGSALVDWLISNSFAVSRFEAVTLASMLMEENFTKPVGARSTGATRYSDLSEQFLDDSTALYMFAETGKKMLSSKEELQFNISELSGTIVKQGYLVKQGHKRKNWKVRKFVLRADPAFLHYYDPTKEENRPVGGFSLRGCLVSALEDNGVPAGVKGNVQGNLFKIITKKDIHYYIQASSKAERTQWIEAIKPLT
uniref:Pleckstrin 2 n=1 Tax=Phasianus colchicus TaxID=9054 RepID=A0A669Q5X0_PHACC